MKVLAFRIAENMMKGQCSKHCPLRLQDVAMSGISNVQFLALHFLAPRLSFGVLKRWRRLHPLSSTVKDGADGPCVTRSHRCQVLTGFGFQAMNL